MADPYVSPVSPSTGSQEESQVPNGPDVLIQERARKVVALAHTTAQNFLNPYFVKYRTFYEMYRGFQSNKHYLGRANLFVPLAFENIEDTNARIEKAFNGIRTQPGDGETSIEVAKQAKLALEHQTKLYNFKKAFGDFRQDASIYGTGILKICWVYDPARKKDHPIPKVIDPADYFFDPDATSRDEARYEIHRSWETLSNLEKNPNYFNLDKLRVSGDVGAGSATPSLGSSGDASDSLRNSRYSAIGVNQPKNEGKIEVLEYWGLFAAEETGNEEEYLITLANDNVIRCEKNPYREIFKDGAVDELMLRPFVLLKDTDVAHQFLGLGMIEPILRLLEELNDTRNQRMDNVTLIVDQMYYVLDEADVDEGDLVARGGGVVYGSVPNGVTRLERGDVTESAYREEVVIKEDIQRALGLSPLAKGAIEGLSGEAMHTVLAILESGNVRIDKKTSAFADAVSQAYQIILAFDQAFIEDPLEIPTEDAEGGSVFTKLSKAEIAGRVKVEVEMDSQMSKILRRAETEKFFATFKGDGDINQQVLKRMYIEEMDRAAFIPELFNVPPPQPPQSEPPKLSVSINGEQLNALQIGELLEKAGVSKQASDPVLDPKMRAMMQGKNPEELDQNLKQAELREKLIQEERLKKRDSSDAILKAKDLELRERELNLKELELASSKATPSPGGGLGKKIAGIFK